MRPFYFLLYVTLPYALRLFYRSIKVINKPVNRYSSTIYVSNHPNSFMDPLVIGTGNNAVVYFMTRSDVFKWWLKPVLWAAHMLPIFRQHDGEDTKKANSRVFQRVNRVLARNRNILIFGEGFTDDTPVRTLKPVKKGAVRMGLSALDEIGWDHKIYVQPLGLNYTARNVIGSDVVMENGDPICLNDYREQYQENPNRIITELTKVLELRMRDTVSCVADKNWFNFHEQIMTVTGKGMNHDFVAPGVSLEDRHQYSKALAVFINQNTEHLESLRDRLNEYFNQVRKAKLSHEAIASVSYPELVQTGNHWLFLFTMWPLAIPGLLHGFLPYILAKKLTERSFGRKVFWGSVKLLLGVVFGTIFNVPIILILNKLVLHNGWLAFGYFLLIPLLCRVEFGYFRQFRQLQKKHGWKRHQADLIRMAEKREEILTELRRVLPEQFTS